ncbi:hypothetical protein ACFY7C_01465 [Streptomyces sp. NPDC012769]|uniref:hypothetical protein n=1 Tax=Streptomyces sp. NPDC012769 TaxID=3364848 RepID=UPI003692E464
MSTPQTDAVVRLVRTVLGDEALGAYPHGSAVLGGLRPLATSTSSSSPAAASRTDCSPSPAPAPAEDRPAPSS